MGDNLINEGRIKILLEGGFDKLALHSLCCKIYNQRKSDGRNYGKFGYYQRQPVT